jgi:hypothetical protein
MNIFNNNKEHCGKGHGGVKHMLHMVLCCGLPAIIILSLPFIARFSPVAAGILGVIAPFICPVMMGGMIIMMLRGNKRSCCEETNPNSNHEITNNK